MKTITIIDDSHLDATLLKNWLENEKYHVTLVFNSGVDAIAHAHEITTDICLVDAHMPLLSGVDTITLLFKKGYPGKAILISHAFSLKCMTEAKQAGAFGYLNKDKNGLLQGLLKVKSNQNAFDDTAYKQWENTTTSKNLCVKDKDHRIDLLNNHHISILKYTCEGLSTKQMCNLMNLKKHTIEQYRATMLRLLGFNNMAQATAWAVANHLVKLSEINATQNQDIKINLYV